ncbi:hypothetical protein A2U01_0047387, partial [Trifolium medium]|nr:hypothetical protein [Trifolium medium]
QADAEAKAVSGWKNPGPKCSLSSNDSFDSSVSCQKPRPESISVSCP